MRKIAPSFVARSLGFGFAVMAAATFAFAPAAHAIECDGMQRSFEGELQKAKGDTIVVDNKKGDKIKFVQPPTPDVSGEKTAWEDLKKGIPNIQSGPTFKCLPLRLVAIRLGSVNISNQRKISTSN